MRNFTWAALRRIFMAPIQNKPKSAAKPFTPAQAVMVAFGRWRVDGHDAKRNVRRFFTGPQAETASKKFAAELNAAVKAKPAQRPHLPAQAVMVAPGRFRVDGRDAKRMYRRFFTGPNAERDAKAHAAQLNSGAKPAAAGAAKPGAKFGGSLGAVVAAETALKAKQAATAKAKADQASKQAVGQFAKLHQETAAKAMEALTPGSTKAQVIFAIRQAELAGLPQPMVEAALKNRGFGPGQISAMVRELQAETAKA
jgi:hypothetical protein